MCARSMSSSSSSSTSTSSVCTLAAVPTDLIEAASDATPAALRGLARSVADAVIPSTGLGICVRTYTGVSLIHTRLSCNSPTLISPHHTATHPSSVCTSVGLLSPSTPTSPSQTVTPSRSAYSSAPGDVAGTGRGVRGGPPSPASGTGGRPGWWLAAEVGVGRPGVGSARVREAVGGPVAAAGGMRGGEMGVGLCLGGDEGLSFATGGGGARLARLSAKPTGAGAARGGRKDTVAVIWRCLTRAASSGGAAALPAGALEGEGDAEGSTSAGTQRETAYATFSSRKTVSRRGSAHSSAHHAARSRGSGGAGAKAPTAGTWMSSWAAWKTGSREGMGDGEKCKRRRDEMDA